MNCAPWLAALVVLAQDSDPARMDDHRGGGALGFSPDGRLLLSHGSEGLHLWEVATRCEKKLEKSTSYSRTAAERQAAFTPDGKEIDLFESERLLAWNSETGARVRSMPGPSGFLAGSLLSPDAGALLSVVSASKGPWTVSLQPASGEKVRTLEVPEGEVGSIAFSPKGDRAAASGVTAAFRRRSAWVRVWETATGRQLLAAGIEPAGQARTPLVRTPSGAISPDGRLLAVVRTPSAPIPGRPGGPSTIQLWDIEAGSACADLEGHKAEVWETAFSREGSRLATWGPSDLIVWTLEEKKALVTREGVIHAAAFAPDGSSIAFISSATEAKHKERRMTVVDLVSLKDRFTLPVAYYHSVAFSPDGKTLAVSSDQRIALWEVASGEAIQR